MFKPIKVTSSLLNKTLTSSTLKNDLKELIKSKISDDCVQYLNNSDELFQKYIDDIETGFKKGHDAVSLLTTDGECFYVSKREIETVLQPYLNQIIRLLNAILMEQNICKKNEIKRIDLTCSLFPILVGTALSNKLSKITDAKYIHWDYKEANSIASIAKLVSLFQIVNKILNRHEF